MFHARRAHSIALVFPESPAIDDFFAASAVFENRQEAFSKERLEAVLDAVEGLRQNGSGARLRAWNEGWENSQLF